MANEYHNVRKLKIVERNTKPEVLVMGDFRRILVPVDGSVTSERAASKAVALAAISKGSIDFLYVATIAGSSAGLPGNQMDLPQEILDKIKSSENVVLQKILANIPDGIPVRTYCEAGKPRQVILEFAEKLRSDIIIMGSRGLNPAESILIGSVSQHLIENARCPVLVVK